MNLSSLLTVPISLLPELQAWLEYPHSTTETLKKHTGEASLQVINQIFRSANWWEEQFLHLHGEVFCREIMISSQGIDCWYGRTMVAKNTYNHHHNFFEKLRTQYLGQIIFNAKEVERVQLSHYFIDHRTIEYYWVKALKPALNQPLGVRLSVFQFLDNQEKFYLVEILLPELLDLLREP